MGEYREMTCHFVKTEEEWLALRKNYITASEAAVLVGADPFSSPSKLRNPSPFSGNAATRVGQMLETIVVNVTNDVLKLNGASPFTLYENPEGHKEFYTCDLLGATPDAHSNRKILLECKTTKPSTYLKYSAVPPSKYLIQLLVQMMCVGVAEGYLAIMSTDLSQYDSRRKDPLWPISIFHVLHNDEIASILKSQAEKFKNNKTFRVDSGIKQKVKLLLPLVYKQVY